MSDRILLVVFGATTLCTYLALAPSPESHLVRQRALAIRRNRPVPQGDGLLDEEMQLPFSRRVLGPALERFYERIGRLAPSKVISALSLRLQQAGSPMKASHFLGVKLMAAGACAAGGFLLMAPSLKSKPLFALTVPVVALVLGWRLPDFSISRMVTQRRRLLEKALPDVLDLLSVSVEAGLGLDGAVQKVGEKFAEPTAGEFRELLKEIRLGTPRAEAFRNLAERTAVPDMRTFVAAVIQAEQLGVSVARVLRVQSESLRTRRKQRIQEKAMALPVKMIFPLAFFIFPTIFIVVLGPVVVTFLGSMGH